jgi:hypothetical protein
LWTSTQREASKPNPQILDKAEKVDMYKRASLFCDITNNEKFKKRVLILFISALPVVKIEIFFLSKKELRIEVEIKIKLPDIKFSCF